MIPCFESNIRTVHLATSM